MNRPSAVFLSPFVRMLLAAIVIVLAAHLLDGWAFENIVDPRVNERDWGRMLRVMGYLPLWGMAALALILCDWPLGARGARRPAFRRGALLFGAAALGGIVAELLKILIRRERPDANAGAYVFRAWSNDTLGTGGLGLPSSHALVAFAAAAMLSHLFPRARVVWWALAVGCALTRVAARAHFLSDIAVSAVVGYLVALLLWRVVEQRPAWHLAGEERMRETA